MLAMVLESEGFDVLTASSGEAAISTIAATKPRTSGSTGSNVGAPEPRSEKPPGAPPDDPIDAVLLDVQLPGINGVATLRKLLELDNDLPVAMISGHATIQDAVEATRVGAFDFLEKPLSQERVVVCVQKCIRERRRALEVRDLRARAERDFASGLLGNAPIMHTLRGQIAKVAPTRGRVLITGESGTGKELIARAVHEQSDRAQGPFVKVNCAAIPGDLIESMLFGHEKGAFTSAVGRRRGQFELADKGTLFLDEIGDMSLSAQAKMLRVLQTGELVRVGSERPIQVDVRVIAATNKDLEKACAQGEFRDDLYFRLNVVPLVSPPLRARRVDIPLLVDFFLLQVCDENNFRRKRCHPEVMQALQRHDWPGNVRELRNMVERLAILSGEAITPADLPAGLGGVQAEGVLGDFSRFPTLRAFREAAEKRFVETRLREMDWNISRTAEALGLERTNLHKKIKALGIKREAQ